MHWHTEQTHNAQSKAPGVSHDRQKVISHGCSCKWSGSTGSPKTGCAQSAELGLFWIQELLQVPIADNSVGAAEQIEQDPAFKVDSAGVPAEV